MAILPLLSAVLRAAEHPETQAGAKALKRMGMIAKAGLDVDAGKDL